VRILYSHRIQSRDGQSVHVEELVAAFRALGHEVVVAGPGFYDQSGFGQESRMVAVIRRLLPGMLAELAELAYNIPAYRRLRRAAAEQTFDLLYERYNLFFLAGAWFARHRKLPYFLEINAPLAEERSRHGGLKLRGLARWAERFVWRRADCALPVTGVLAGHVTAAGADPARVRVVPNGVVLDRFPPAPPHAPRARGAGLRGVRARLARAGCGDPWHGRARRYPGGVHRGRRRPGAAGAGGAGGAARRG
jgi:glycosyltransferase involved in cell wall biosynthesis